jgi:twinkle protein
LENLSSLLISGKQIDRWQNKWQDKVTVDDMAEVTAAKYFEKAVIDYFDEGGSLQGLSLPWSKTDSLFRIRKGEITLWHGFNGSGKSSVLGFVTLGQLQIGQKIVIMSMEMKPEQTLARMIRQAYGVKTPSKSAIKDFFKWVDGKLWIYDQIGSVPSKRVLGLLGFSKEILRVDQVVVDSLMKCGVNVDDNQEQNQFANSICAAAKQYNIHIHLVHHDRKTENEDQMPNKMSARGSSTVADQVDNIIGVWRNKPKERKIEEGEASNEPDYILLCDKQRNGEWEGKIALWSDKDSLYFKEFEHQRVESFVKPA